MWLVGLLSIATWVMFVAGVLLGLPLGEVPIAPGFIVTVWIVFGLIMPAVFLTARLTVRVDERGLRLRYFPFQLNWFAFSRDDVEACEAVVFKPFEEYGGWGVRVGPLGTAFIARGNQGVHISLKDGRNMLIGSRRSEELVEAISSASTSTKPSAL